MYIYICLVGGTPTPLKNMKVSWDDYSQYMENIFAGWWGKRTSKKKAHKWMMIIALYAKNHDLLSRDPPSTK